MLVVNQYVPHQLRGIVLAGFLAAFMSTIATQLNWGTSYLVEDFYRRFVRRHAAERHYVNVSRFVTLLLVIATGYVSAQLASIRSGWEIVLELGAGTGSVYILRWFWWRINAWSEISAMASSLAVTAAIRSSTLASIFLHRNSFFSGNSSVVFAKTSLVTTLVTSCAWISVTLLTKPEAQRNSGGVLSQGSATNSWLETGRGAGEGNSRNAGPGAKFVVLVSRLRDDVQRALWRGQGAAGAAAAGNFSAAARGCVRVAGRSRAFPRISRGSRGFSGYARR